jgi:hypothetical protein
VISHLFVLYRPKCRDFWISTGNKGVDQLVINFFSKCGIPLILFPLILALFCMTGCLEKVPELSVTPSTMPQDQAANQRLQMDFDAELRSDLLSVRGNIMLPGNSSLAYLMLNATLCQGKKEQFNTKYLLMQIEPNRDYSFEITKNVKIPAGEYDCTLEAKGPQGVLAEESRKVSLVSGQKPVFEQVPWPVELEEEISRQKNEEEREKEESDPQKEISNDAAKKKVPVVKAGKQSGSTSAGGSLRESSTLSKENGTFMGSITSKKYHRLDCRYALKIKPENRIYFQSVEDAKVQGYLPCKSCSP